MDIYSIAVCGAGTMGAGIAQVAAAAGFPTLLFDAQPAALEKGLELIRQNLSTAVERGKIAPANMEATLARITPVNDVALCMADVIIEAIVEKMEAKTALFTALAAVNKPDTLFATNTSSLSVSAIAAGIPHPERLGGMHFFNPAPLMKLVEVVKGKQTSSETWLALHKLVERFGKTAVSAMDAPGFIVNRVARHYYLEAMQTVDEGVASIKAADRLLEAAGFRMGPFALMDLIGNDVNYAVTVSLYEAFERAPRFRPGRLQAELVAKGQLGRKTGQGFYKY
ncbi:3-hydroxyacyl-CoA dehydrogenase NAD-binding domain-containing protein [Chitinophaga lutea]